MDGDGEGRPEGSGEGRNEREDFSEYVEYLREKYGEGGGADTEKVESKQEEPEDSRSPEGLRAAAAGGDGDRMTSDDVEKYRAYLLGDAFTRYGWGMRPGQVNQIDGLPAT